MRNPKPVISEVILIWQIGFFFAFSFLFLRIFSVCAPPPPSLVGTYYLQPPDARAYIYT